MSGYSGRSRLHTEYIALTIGRSNQIKLLLHRRRVAQSEGRPIEILPIPSVI